MSNNTNEWVKFNLHNLVAMRIHKTAPTVLQFQEMFRPFLTDEDLLHYDLTIKAELEPLPNCANGETHGET